MLTCHNRLKVTLTSSPTLVSLDFSPSAGAIIATVDASKVGWGGILQQQQDDGRVRPARYESRIWNKAEKEYECGQAGPQNRHRVPAHTELVVGIPRRDIASALNAETAVIVQCKVEARVGAKLAKRVVILSVAAPEFEREVEVFEDIGEGGRV